MATNLDEAMYNQVAVVINCARLVCVFDGTDRNSLEMLRNSLFALGVLEAEFKNRQQGCD